MLNKLKRFTLLGLLVAGTTLAFTGCGTTAQQSTQTAQTIANWSETFDGTTTNFSVNTPPTHAVSMSKLLQK